MVSIKLYYSIINTTYPHPLYNLLKKGQNNNVNTHQISKFYPITKSKLADTKDSFIYKMSEIYNSLPQTMINLSKLKFNTQINQYAINNFSSDRLHKMGGYTTT